MWEPLFAIADAAGENWASMAQAAAVSIMTGALVEDESIGVQLLADCQVAFGGDDRVTTEGLIERLSEDAETPWGTWHHGNPISPRALAAKLKPYRIHSRDIRTSEGTRKGYFREQFEDAWNRYLPPKPPSIRDMGDIPHEYSDRTPFSIRDTTPSVADSEEAANPHGQTDVADVADRTPEYGDGQQVSLNGGDPGPEEIERLAGLARKAQAQPAEQDQGRDLVENERVILAEVAELVAQGVLIPRDQENEA